MRKSELIAQCLVEAGIVRRLEDGMGIFRRVWQASFAGRDLKQWDSHVPKWLEQRFLDEAKRTTQIDVEKFIEDLTA